jgi:uncharacterized protein YndB with AHSA1/START domain
MADVLHDLRIKAPPDAVFRAVSTAEGLDQWWTKRSAGQTRMEAEYALWFGPEYDWRAQVTRCVRGVEFELQRTGASPDWVGTRVGCTLDAVDGGPLLRFRHTGRAEPSEHFRISSSCWAECLRILARYLERGEKVPYDRRRDSPRRPDGPVLADVRAGAQLTH